MNMTREAAITTIEPLILYTAVSGVLPRDGRNTEALVNRTPVRQALDWLPDGITP